MKKTGSKAKASKKAAPKSSKKTSRLQKITKTTKKMVDDLFIKMGPGVQTQISKLQSLMSAEGGVQELKVLGLKALEKAQAVSQNLRTTKKAAPRTSKKKTSAKK